MSNEYILVLRDQDNHIYASMSHNQANLLQELSVLHNYLLNNLEHGAARAEVHSLLPGEKLSQAVERIKQDHPRPLTSITKDDLSVQEIREQGL